LQDIPVVEVAVDQASLCRPLEQRGRQLLRLRDEVRVDQCGLRCPIEQRLHHAALRHEAFDI
jgi:hypothetical protein